jgi:hypothetical protein
VSTAPLSGAGLEQLALPLSVGERAALAHTLFKASCLPVLGEAGHQPWASRRRKTGRCLKADGGFSFLGCPLRVRMGGRLWQRKGLRRHCLQRWSRRKAMHRGRATGCQ